MRSWNKPNPLARPRLQVMVEASSQRFSTRTGFKPIWQIFLNQQQLKRAQCKWRQSLRLNILYILRKINHYLNGKWTMKHSSRYWDQIKFILQPILYAVYTVYLVQLKTGMQHEIKTQMNVHISKSRYSMPPMLLLSVCSSLIGPHNYIFFVLFVWSFRMGTQLKLA